MSDQMVLRMDDAVVGEVDISLGILRERNTPEHVLTVLRLLQVSQAGNAVQDITGGLDPHTQVEIGAVRRSGIIGAVRTEITPIQDEMVLITGDQDRRAVEETLLEGIRHPRHVDIIDIDQVELMGPAATGLAWQEITQTGISDRTGVLVWSLLVVIGYVDLHVRCELQPCLCPTLDSTSAVGTPFVRTTSADGEHFGTAEEVLIRIVESRRYSPISGAVGTFDLHGKRVTTTAGDSDVTIQQAVSCRHKSDVDVLDRCQGVHACIGALFPPFGIRVPATDATRRTDGVHTQETMTGPTVLVAESVGAVLQFERVRQAVGVIVHLVMHVPYLITGT